MKRWTISVVVVIAAFVLINGVDLTAQRGAAGRGAPATPRAAAPVDITGLWVSVVTEDWRWRMRTPPKGDYASVPLNAAATKVADSWDPAQDTAAGEQCRAYGAASIMRMPGRVRISWNDENTLKVETEAGTQTRLLQFSAPAQAGAPSWQGTSVANWQMAGGGGNRRGGGPPPRGGSLRVVTTNMRAGYLRKNGVPYSANARLTEYINRTTEPNGDSWLIVTTLVEDPQFLTSRFVTSSHFKKVADGSAWTPTPCSAS
ncbi:MAG TPA: hypothetical protein VKB50_00625 [Vicinamibacterales bacterium]|nr:hypothetical protein [Vicinamibacterales bacterium]